VSCAQEAAAPPRAAEDAPRQEIQDIAGVYVVRQDKPLDPRVYDLDIAGVSLRTYWRNIEPERGCFDWSLFDEAIDHCAKRNKKVRLAIMFGTGVPTWVGAKWFVGSPDSEPAADPRLLEADDRLADVGLDPVGPQVPGLSRHADSRPGRGLHVYGNLPG
jgi:hypothetical protein